jgi:hypothetical protein
MPGGAHPQMAFPSLVRVNLPFNELHLNLDSAITLAPQIQTLSIIVPVALLSLQGIGPPPWAVTRLIVS